MPVSVPPINAKFYTDWFLVDSNAILVAGIELITKKAAIIDLKTGKFQSCGTLSRMAWSYGQVRVGHVGSLYVLLRLPRCRESASVLVAFRPSISVLGGQGGIPPLQAPGLYIRPLMGPSNRHRTASLCNPDSSGTSAEDKP
jgi:hypothetical protein